jgi:ATP-dependent RNA helicase DeaD
MQRFLSLVHELSETEEGTGLMAMLLDDFYQETFYAPVAPPSEDRIIRQAKPQRSKPRSRSERDRKSGYSSAKSGNERRRPR